MLSGAQSSCPATISAPVGVAIPTRACWCPPYPLAWANHATVEGVLGLLATDTVSPGFGTLSHPTTIGVGHSMGANLTIILQAHRDVFDAVAILGYSAFHTALPVPPGTGPVAATEAAKGVSRWWSGCVDASPARPGSSAPHEPMGRRGSCTSATTPMATPSCQQNDASGRRVHECRRGCCRRGFLDRSSGVSGLWRARRHAQPMGGAKVLLALTRHHTGRDPTHEPRPQQRCNSRATLAAAAPLGSSGEYARHRRRVFVGIASRIRV